MTLLLNREIKSIIRNELRHLMIQRDALKQKRVIKSECSLIVIVVLRSGIVVVIIYVGTGLRIVVGVEVGMVALNAIVDNRDRNVFARIAEEPRLTHIHIKVSRGSINL